MRMAYPSAEGLVASPEIEIAESGTMLDSKGKFNDLKSMLDSNKENVKMDAMRRIIQMVARGKDVSELFPAVVKNVAAKNLELKKLVYVYLVRYAEEQQDLALLSISTFQRGLKDPNQLIRASALRVLSSIRVQMIAPVMMLAIRESVRDMSPYVRKVAAHAIPKLFALDPELQSGLIECIDFLLGDKRTLVLGSAVYAFEQTCPDRLDLLHRHFRLLCRALADVDEWGQIVMIGLLTRYARTQFLSPFPSRRKSQPETSEMNGANGEKQQQEDGENDKNTTDEDEGNEDHHYRQPLDPDHNLLISSVRPLLQSRNPAVVVAVAQLLFYIAPHSQLSVVPRAMVRLLRGPKEVQHIVLVNIASICCCLNNAKQQQEHQEMFAISKNLFEPFLKSFFVRSSEPIHVKQLKLQVLTSLVTEANVQLVIRELQAYMQMTDLAEAAIDGIGRCALQVPSAAESCLAILIRIISNGHSPDTIVCASVVVLKRLLHSEAPIPLLRRLFRLIDNVKAPMARACILWLIGMHLEKAPKLGPDLLRKVAKTFVDEAECVKLQSMNLAVRLWITDSANRQGKCALLIDYIFQLARFDRSYDIRDRCRFLRNFLFGPQAKSGQEQSPQILAQNSHDEVEENGEKIVAEDGEDLVLSAADGVENVMEQNDDTNGMMKFPLEILLSEPPAPVLQNAFADRAEHFQLGTLSHLLNQKCVGYRELPEFPQEQPDPTIRRSAFPLPSDLPKPKAAKDESEEEDEDEFTSDEDEEEESDEESDEEEEDEDEDDINEDEDNSDESEMNEADAEENKAKGKPAAKSTAEVTIRTEGQGICSSSSSSLKQLKVDTKNLTSKAAQMPKKEEKKSAKNAIEDLLLLDLDFGPSILATTESSAAGADGICLSKWPRAVAQWAPNDFPLNLIVPVVSGGLTMDGRFCRSPCLFSSSMVCLELQLSFRHSQLRSTDVQLEPILSCSLLTSGALTLRGLAEGERRRLTIGIDFADTAQTAEWTIKWGPNSQNTAKFQVQAPCGEQMEPIEMPEAAFLSERAKMGGMNQLREPIAKPPDSFTARELYKLANCKQVTGLKFCFAGQTISRKQLVLISFLPQQQSFNADSDSLQDSSPWSLQINCENMAFGAMVIQELAQHFSTI